MFKRFQYFIFILFLFSLLCSPIRAQHSKPIQLKIEDITIPPTEFQQFLEIHDPLGEKKRRDNIQAYVNYQLKLYEARQLRFDTLSSYKNELSEFRNTYATKFLNFDRLDEDHLREYYRRTITEVEISHFRIDIQGDLYKDTLNEYTLVDSLRTAVSSGAGFRSLAAKYSDAQTAADSGHLGFITGMQVPFPLEEMAFETEPGSVSKIYRTSGSYHLVFVYSQKPSRGTVHIMGIYKKGGRSYPAEHNLQVKKELDSLRNLAESGLDFKRLALKHSDLSDEGEKEPYFPPIRSGGNQPGIADAAFSLEKDGQISPIVKTPQGYYILRREAFQALRDFHSMKPEIRDYYSNNPTRRNYLHDKFLRYVLNYYGFNFYQDAYKKFVTYGKNAFHQGKWIPPEDLDSDRIIFEIGDSGITFNDFSSYLGNKEFAWEFINYPPVIGKHFQDFFFIQIYEYQKQHLEDRYQAFGSIMKQFQKTLLIQRIQDEMLQQASNDSRGLENQFNKNRKKYTVQGFEGLIIQFSTMRDRQKLEFMINNLDFDTDILQDTLEAYNNVLNIRRVRVRKGENDVIDHFIWRQSRFQPHYSLIMVKGQKVQLPARNYQEALTEVLLDYSEHFEDRFIRTLKKNYNVRVK